MENRIWDKLDRLDERLDRIEIVLTRNTDSLDTHIKRTAQLEERMKPVEDHVKMVAAGTKVGAIILSGATGLAGLLKALGLL